METRFSLNDNELGAVAGKRFAHVGTAIMQSTLPTSTRELVSVRASQINGCGACLDAHTKELAAAGEPAVRINLVAAWRESTVFTEAEQAALALAEEGTRLGDGHQGVSDDTWAQVRRHYDDDQVAALVYQVAMINAANRLLVITHTKGGSTSRARSTAWRAEWRAQAWLSSGPQPWTARTSERAASRSQPRNNQEKP